MSSTKNAPPPSQTALRSTPEVSLNSQTSRNGWTASFVHREEVLAEYSEAMFHERDLWERVKDKRPGTRDHDKGLWDAWLKAVARTEAASRALREAYSLPAQAQQLRR